MNLQASEDLLAAIKLNRLDDVRAALSRGADPNFTRTGYTPLLMAVDDGNQEVLQLLLDHGASPDEANVTGWYPVHAAAAAGHVAMLRPLVGKMMFAQVRDEDGIDPLRAGVDARREDVVAELISLGFSPNRTDQKGVSPLAVAVMNQDEGIVRCLVAAGADWGLVAGDGRSPRDHLGDWPAGQCWKDASPATSPATRSAGAVSGVESPVPAPAEETGVLGLSRIRRRTAL